MNHLKLTPLALVAALAVQTLSATIVFDDDFESYSLGNDQSASGGGKIYNGFGVADQTTATPFGSPNKFGYLDGGSSFVRVALSSELMTYSFDLYEPTTVQTGPTRFGLGQGDVNQNAYAAWSIDNGVLSTLDNTSLESGSLPTLQQDRHYTTYIVHNGSASDQAISGTGAILEAGETALYFYDTTSSTLIDAGIYAHTNTKVINSFLIRSFGADDNTLYFDNIILDDSLSVIPEPSAYATILGSAAFVLLMRRKRVQC